MSQVIQHVGAGANSGAYESDGDNDLTYGFLTGNSSQMLMETLNVQNTVQHSDSAQVNNMARLFSTGVFSFGEKAADTAVIGIGPAQGSNVAAATEAINRGMPMYLVNASTGALLTEIDSIYQRQLGATGHALELVVNTDNSTGYTNDTTLPSGNVLPHELSINIDTHYGASTVTFANDLTGATQQTGNLPFENCIGIRTATATSFDFFAQALTPVTHTRTTDSVTTTTLTDSSKATEDFNAGSYAVVAGDNILALAADGGYGDYDLAIVTASAADLLTFTGGWQDFNALTATGTHLTVAYWVIEALYAGIISSYSSDELLIDSSQGWTDSTFVTNMATGKYFAYNMTTGLVVRIHSVVTSSNTNINLAYSGGPVQIVRFGYRAGVRDNQFQANDIYVIMPEPEITALYTDPSASSGGGGSTRIIDHNIIG